MGSSNTTEITFKCSINVFNIMARQQLIEIYERIEKQRKSLKEEWCFLKKTHGDKIEIKKLGQQLSKLTLNQIHILIDLEWLDETD